MSNLRKVIDIDSAGNEALNGIFGESMVEVRQDDVSVQFQYNYYDEQFDVNPEAVTGDGATTVANSMASVSSATTGTASRESKDSIRYRAGRTGYALFTASFNGTGVGQAGCFDDLDGFPLQVSNGNASFGYLKNGVHKGSLGAAGFDDEANWNGNTSPGDIDFTKLNIFFITFGYLGTANATLWVKKDKWLVLHTVKTEGVLTTTHVDSPVFPVSIYAENGMTVKSGSWAGGTLGTSAVGKRNFSFPNTIVSGTGAVAQSQVAIAANTTETMVIFRSKALFHSKHNHIISKLVAYRFHLDIPSGTNQGVVIFQIVGVQTLSGAATYADINSTSSVMEYDHTPATGASVSVTAGVPIVTENLEWAGSNKGATVSDSAVDAEKIGAIAHKGDVFAVIAKNIGGTDVVARATMLWNEF